jgi:hypothetical protein
MADQIDSILKKLYYDPKTGYISAPRLYEKAKEIEASISLKKVKDWYSRQLDIQQFEEQRGPLDHFKIASYNPDSWQMDLAFITTGAERQLIKSKPILTAVNINSRIGYATLLKDKKAATVLAAIKALCNSYKVEIITTDNGSEFMNRTAQQFFADKKIEHYNNEPGDHATMGKIERFNRTLKQRLVRMPNKRVSQVLLNDVISNYNNTTHRSIGMTPNEAKGKVIESELKHNQETTDAVENRFVIGDSVRVKLKPKTFGKESVKWGKIVYEIIGIDGYKIQIRSKNNHTLYKQVNELKVVKADATDAPLDDNQIWEAERILDHKQLKNGKNKYLVKWVGYDKPTWESQDNMRLINKNKISPIEQIYFK